MRCVWCTVGLAVGSAHLTHITRCPHPSPPSCCWTPTPSVEWTRWSSRWHQRASRRPRKGRPTTLPPSLHPHHPILPPCKATHTCLGSTGWVWRAPLPSHIHTTTHPICHIAPGGGAAALLAPLLTIWPTNTGLYLHEPMQAISLTTPSPAPLYRHKAAERPPTDSASQGYRHSCE